LRRLVDALGEDYALLFVALSYRWLTKDHPDPEAFQLRSIAKVAALYMEGKKYGEIYTSPLTEAFATKGLGPPDFALFWDWASLFQKPRTEAEEVLFLPGLKSSNVWYGHEAAVCWMQTELPEGFSFAPGLAKDYDESGWCFVEAAISSGLKVGKRRLDLGVRTNLAMTTYGGGICNLSPACTIEGVCAARREPPLVPDKMRQRLETKKFTSSADADVVFQLYRSFFDGAAATATHLTFAGLEWGVAEVELLLPVLSRFTALTVLDLSQNKLEAAGGASVARYLTSNTRLQSLKCVPALTTPCLPIAVRAL